VGNEDQLTPSQKTVVLGLLGHAEFSTVFGTQVQQPSSASIALWMEFGGTQDVSFFMFPWWNSGSGCEGLLFLDNGRGRSVAEADVEDFLLRRFGVELFHEGSS
jgi:hypothetical protein